MQGFALTIFFFHFYNSVKFDLHRVKSRCELNSNFLCLIWEMWKKPAPETSSPSTGSQYWHSKPLIIPVSQVTPFSNAETQLHHLVRKQENLPSQARAAACAEAIPCSQSANNTAWIIELWPGTQPCAQNLALWRTPHTVHGGTCSPTCWGWGLLLKSQVPGSTWKHLQLRSSEVLSAFVLQT